MKKRIFLILLISCILFSISGVSAHDINDTTVTEESVDLKLSNSDENQLLNDDGDLSEDGTFTSLQLKIALAPDGSTINLTRDYKYSDDFKITTGVFIDKDITINGNGHTIDGMGKSRIFNINYGHQLHQNKVTLNNIIFQNGNAEIYGGAILNFGDLTIDKCYFTNNNAGTAGGAVNSLGALTLKNSQFNKNSAGGDAGAVFSLTLKKSPEFYYNYFEGKNATDDINLIFAIAMQALLEHGKDSIYNCVFNNNIANGNGGGAVYAYSNIDIDSCTFNSNKAGEKGGAVFGCKDLYIENSKFTGNKVSMYGGAVYFKCHEQSGHYENGKWVSSIKYYKNLIESSTFADNVANERGGAIYGFRTSDSDKVNCAKAVKCTFSDNKAPKGKDIYGGTVKDCKYINTKITLKTATVKKSAKKLTLQATLKKGSTALKGKQVTFKFNGKTYKAKTNSKGIAKVTIKKSILKKLKVGKTIKYQVKYSSFIAKKTAKVKK